MDSDTLQIETAGAPVTGLGKVGTFTTETVAAQDQSGAERNFGDIAVGPKGQLLVTWQEPSTDSGPSQIFVSLDPDGFGPKAFGAPVVAASINVGGFTPIHPQANRTVAAEANLAWDHSSGPYAGRVYLAYMDAAQVGDAKPISSCAPPTTTEPPGATRCRSIRTSDAGSQFLPSIALDESSGALAIGWYSASGDPNGVKSQFEVAASIDGGASFSPMAVASLGASDATDPKLDEAGQSTSSAITPVSRLRGASWRRHGPTTPPSSLRFPIARTSISPRRGSASRRSPMLR